MDNLMSILLQIKGVSRISLKYMNSSGEISLYSVNMGASYENAKKADIETLESVEFSGIKEEARLSLLKSLKKPQTNRSNAQKDAYLHITNGLKIHKETGKAYIFGMAERKYVQSSGNYKEVKSRPLTIAKRSLEKELDLKKSKFRTFVIDTTNLIELKAMGETFTA